MANMPKRRKSKDNPYSLNYNEENNTYKVSFKDGINIFHEIEVSEKIYEAFDKFELEDISQMHKYERHIEHSEIYENTLNNRAVDKPVSLEQEVENKIMVDELKNAINLLSEVQKRRLKMYYFEDMTLKQIADIEGCSPKNVFKSIEQAKENIKKNLKN